MVTKHSKSPKPKSPPRKDPVMKRLATTIHPYPTQAEAIQQTGAAYFRTKLTPRTKRFLSFLLRLLN